MVTHSNPEGDATGIGPGPTDRTGSCTPSLQPGLDTSPASCRVAILNGLGFHLRPIERFVAVAQKFHAEIQVRYEGKSCNGRSILDLMSLAAECGTEMELVAWGSDSREVLDALAALVASRFYEDDLGQPLQEPAR